ncbi:MAG TPA: outer membrane beta-barrel protein [Vicinamibacterales bacterium]
MRIGSVLFAAVMAIGLAAPAAAQDPPGPRMFAGGLAGVTFGTETSSAIAGQFGVRIARDLFVIGEFGRMQNVLPDEVADQLPLAEEFFEAIVGIPLNIEVKTPALYAFGGIRWQQSGRRIAPFAEAGLGFAHLTGDFKVNGLDIEDVLEEFAGDFGDLIDLDDVINRTANEFLLTFGGGVNIGLTRTVSVDAGYRFTRIFTEEFTPFLDTDAPAPNTSMVYGAVKFLFGR